jgi:hypothetical protein
MYSFLASGTSSGWKHVLQPTTFLQGEQRPCQLPHRLGWDFGAAIAPEHAHRLHASSQISFEKTLALIIPRQHQASKHKHPTMQITGDIGGSSVAPRSVRDI